MKRYGFPYMGSKNQIAKWIVDQLPAGGTFYDLFCGGCAVTHCAMESGKWDRFVINDIDPLVPQFFIDAIHGKFKDRTEWVSREEFFAKKDTDPLVKFVWSFGNRGATYLYSRENESIKEIAHKMLTAPTIQQRRLFYRCFMRALKRELSRLENDPNAGSIRNLERLDGLESLSQIQGLERLDGLEVYSRDYSEVPITDDGVIYCDIPYSGTAKYSHGAFDHERFYEWCEAQELPVYISEYSAPPPADFSALLKRKRQFY